MNTEIIMKSIFYLAVFTTRLAVVFLIVACLEKNDKTTNKLAKLEVKKSTDQQSKNSVQPQRDV